MASEQLIFRLSIDFHLLIERERNKIERKAAFNNS